MLTYRYAIAPLIATICLASAARAQTYDVPWHIVNAGGTVFCEGGGHELAGSIGLPTGYSEMAGGGYELVGGFWNVEIAIPCIGDIDRDRDVDLQDLAFLLGHFGQTSGATLADGDVEGDGDVDLQDLAFLLADFGLLCP